MRGRSRKRPLKGADRKHELCVCVCTLPDSSPVFPSVHLGASEGFSVKRRSVRGTTSSSALTGVCGRKLGETGTPRIDLLSIIFGASPGRREPDQTTREITACVRTCALVVRRCAPTPVWECDIIGERTRRLSWLVIFGSELGLGLMGTTYWGWVELKVKSWSGTSGLPTNRIQLLWRLHTWLTDADYDVLMCSSPSSLDLNYPSHVAFKEREAAFWFE